MQKDFELVYFTDPDDTKPAFGAARFTWLILNNLQSGRITDRF